MHSLGGSGWSSAFTCPCSRDCMWSGQLSAIYIYSPRAVRRSASVCTDRGGFGAGWCRGFHESSPHLRKRKSEPLLPLSSEEWDQKHTGVHILPSRSTTDHKRALEGVCTSCTNQAHYSLVCMCTPCTKPHPPPLWWSRSRVVVTSYHVLIGSATGAAHTHTWSTYTYVGIYSICILCHFTILSVTDPSVTQC